MTLSRTMPAAPGAIGRAYWLAWAATLVFFAGFYALLVPLPRHMAAAGLADWQIGLVLGAFGVAALIGRPLAGMAADRWGSRRVMLLGAAMLCAGAAGTAGAGGASALFALRLLQAAGYVAFTTAGTALVIALAPPAERGSRLAVFGAAANVSMSVTPALVGALLGVMPLSGAFWLAAGLALAAGALAAAVGAPAPPLEPAPQPDDGPIAHSLRSIVRRAAAQLRPPRALRLAMVAAGLMGASFAAFFQFAPILAERRGAEAGLLYSAYGAGIIATRLVSGRWLDRAGAARAVALGALLMAGGLALAAAAAGTGALVVAAVLIAAGSGLIHPALLAHHALVLPGAPGRASAAFYVGFDLGIGLGSWALGAALEVAGVGGMYAAAALAALAMLALSPALGRQRALRIAHQHQM